MGCAACVATSCGDYGLYRSFGKGYELCCGVS